VPPLPTARSKRVSTRSSPIHNSSACTKYIHRTSARTQALSSVISDHTRRVGVQAPRAPVLILLPSSSRPTRAISDGERGATTPLAITAHRKRQHSRSNRGSASYAVSIPQMEDTPTQCGRRRWTVGKWSTGWTDAAKRRGRQAGRTWRCRSKQFPRGRVTRWLTWC
jgi:hypothetical protein